MPPRRRARRLRVVEKLNLSEHTLDVNIRRCSYDKFRFSEIEDYVLALTGNREYQFQAIKQTMIYLWGGAYALNRSDRLGTLLPGYQADVCLWDAEDIDFLPYAYGNITPEVVFKEGEVVAALLTL